MAAIKRMYAILNRGKKSEKLSTKIKVFEFMNGGYLLRKIGCIRHVEKEQIQGYEGMFVHMWYNSHKKELFFQSIMVLTPDEFHELVKINNGEVTSD